VQIPYKRVVKWDAPFNDHTHWPHDTDNEKNKTEFQSKGDMSANEEALKLRRHAAN